MKLPASPWDYVTSTDKQGRVRFDPRKSFECGSFLVSTTCGSILIYQQQFSEWFFIGYMAAWTAARWLRDREQRMTESESKKPAKATA